MDDLDRLLRGIAVYQDVVVDGTVVRRGMRDCDERWRQIAPHLPARGTLLDIGANFAWFAQQWCAEQADRTAVAIEADLRSAAVARYALAANRQTRVVLSTALAEAPAIRPIVGRGRFDVALCLSILHWIPDHREFLATLGRISDRILIEQPDPKEAGAGREDVRREIGAIGPYLTLLFPDRPTKKIAEWKSHRHESLLRELWMVGPPSAGATNESPLPAMGVRLAELARLDVAWPPQSWWSSQFEQLKATTNGELAQRLQWTSGGLTVAAAVTSADPPFDPRRFVAGIPETGVATWRQRIARLLRAVARRCRLRR